MLESVGLLEKEAGVQRSSPIPARVEAERGQALGSSEASRLLKGAAGSPVPVQPAAWLQPTRIQTESLTSDVSTFKKIKNYQSDLGTLLHTN